MKAPKWSQKTTLLAKELHAELTLNHKNWHKLKSDADHRAAELLCGALLQLLEELGHPLPDTTKNLSWPIAWGWAGLAWQLSKSEVIEGYLFSWISNQLSAAVRLLPLGPTRAQVLQSNLLPLITKQAELLQNKDPRHLWTGDVGATMAQLSHAELYSRLFRS